MAPLLLHTPLRVLLVSSNFCRKNEPRDAYGASCLVSAFRNSPANAGDTLDVFTSDLNRFQKATATLISTGASLQTRLSPRCSLTATM